MLRSSEFAESGVKVSSRILSRYLLRGEQVEVATRSHWGKLAEPIGTVLLGFFILAWSSSGLVDVFGRFGLYAWCLWGVLLVRLLWKAWEWRHEWFCATNKRLLLTYGLFTHNVAMMPIGKVTDLNYSRSLLGRALGYGAFTLESAGQDQALSRIDWIPTPDETYQRICDIIFGDDRFDSEDDFDSKDTSSQDVDPTSSLPVSSDQPPRRRQIYVKRRGRRDDGRLADRNTKQ